MGKTNFLLLKVLKNTESAQLCKFQETIATSSQLLHWPF